MENNLQQLNLAPKAKNNSAIAVILIVVAAVLVISSVLAYHFFLKLTPKELFMVAEAQNIKNISKTLDEMKDSTQVQMAQYCLENPSHIVTRLSGDIAIKGNSYIEQEWERIRDIIKKSKIIIDSKNDPTSAKKATEMVWELNGSSLLNTQIYIEDNTYAFKLPVIYDKFFTLKNERLRDELEKLGMYNTDEMPNKFVSFEEIMQAIELPKEKIEKMKEKYAKFIYDYLQEEDFKLENNVFVRASDHDIKCKKVTLELSEDRFKELLVELSYQFRDDNELQEMISENTYNLVKLFGDAGYIPEYELERLLDKKELKNILKEGASDFKDGVKNLSFEDGIKISLWLDGKKNIVKRVVNLEVHNKDHDDLKAYFEFEGSRWTNKDKSTDVAYHLKVYPKSKFIDGKSEMTAEIKLRSMPDKDKGYQNRLEFDTRLYDEGDLEFKLFGDLDTECMKKDGDKEVSSTAMDIAYEDGDNNVLKFKGTINQESEGTIKDKHIDTSSDIKLDVSYRDGYSDETVEISTTFNADNEISLNEALEFPELTSENSIEIFKLTDEERYQLGNEIQTKLVEFFEKNSYLINLFVGY